MGNTLLWEIFLENFKPEFKKSNIDSIDSSFLLRIMMEKYNEPPNFLPDYIKIIGDLILSSVNFDRVHFDNKISFVTDFSMELPKDYTMELLGETHINYNTSATDSDKFILCQYAKERLVENVEEYKCFKDYLKQGEIIKGDGMKSIIVGYDNIYQSFASLVHKHGYHLKHTNTHPSDPCFINSVDEYISKNKLICGKYFVGKIVKNK